VPTIVPVSNLREELTAIRRRIPGVLGSESAGAHPFFSASLFTTERFAAQFLILVAAFLLFRLSRGYLFLGRAIHLERSAWQTGH
jgi:hypothetical protein